MRGEERELKEIVGVLSSGTGSTPEPRPTHYNRSGIWEIPIFPMFWISRSSSRVHPDRPGGGRPLSGLLCRKFPPGR